MMQRVKAFEKLPRKEQHKPGVSALPRDVAIFVPAQEVFPVSDPVDGRDRLRGKEGCETTTQQRREDMHINHPFSASHIPIPSECCNCDRTDIRKKVLVLAE